MTTVCVRTYVAARPSSTDYIERVMGNVDMVMLIDRHMRASSNAVFGNADIVRKIASYIHAAAIEESLVRQRAVPNTITSPRIVRFYRFSPYGVNTVSRAFREVFIGRMCPTCMTAEHNDHRHVCRCLGRIHPLGITHDLVRQKLTAMLPS
jgi:hypothetical protein